MFYLFVNHKKDKNIAVNPSHKVLGHASNNLEPPSPPLKKNLSSAPNSIFKNRQSFSIPVPTGCTDYRFKLFDARLRTLQQGFTVVLILLTSWDQNQTKHQIEIYQFCGKIKINSFTNEYFSLKSFKVSLLFYNDLRN